MSLIRATRFVTKALVVLLLFLVILASSAMMAGGTLDLLHTTGVVGRVFDILLLLLFLALFVWAVGRLVRLSRTAAPRRRESYIGSVLVWVASGLARLGRTRLPQDQGLYVAQAEPTVSEPSPRYEPQLVAIVRDFKPAWRLRNGRRVLEGGENGNNANLAQHLRRKGISDVETEVTLPNGSRVDIFIDNHTVIECKPTLLSTDTLHKLKGEMGRAKRLGYEAYGVIYGDTRDDLLEELTEYVGASYVIVLR